MRTNAQLTTNSNNPNTERYVLNIIPNYTAVFLYHSAPNVHTQAHMYTHACTLPFCRNIIRPKSGTVNTKASASL